MKNDVPLLDQRKVFLEDEYEGLIERMRHSINENDWVNVTKISLRLVQKQAEIARLKLEIARNEKKRLALRRAITQEITDDDLENATGVTDAVIQDFSNLPHP